MTDIKTFTEAVHKGEPAPERHVRRAVETNIREEIDRLKQHIADLEDKLEQLQYEKLQLSLQLHISENTPLFVRKEGPSC